jgi:two-component system sensor histidine kinase PilS (NtrC family)
MIVDAILERQLKLVMLLRVVVVTTLLLSAIYVESFSETLSRFNPLYFVITATYVLTIGYVWSLRTGILLQLQAQVQFSLDLLVITGLIYVTGTVYRGGFMLLYPMSVLSGAVILSRHRGLALAALATIFYGTLLFVVREGLIRPLGLAEIPSLEPRFLMYLVFLTAVACSTVAVIGGYLSDSVRRMGVQLEEAEGQVADLQELNELIVNGIHSGLLTSDATGRILFLNPFGEQILGQRFEDLKGAQLDRVFQSPALGPALLDARDTAGLRRLGVIYQHPTGRSIDLGMSVSTLGAPGGGRHLLVFQDLTEIKRLEEEVRIKEKLAAVGEMAAHLAHEIRNPLGSISGSAQVLMIEKNMSPDQERLLSIIHKECKRLSDSLHQFLVRVRPVPRSRDPVDLRGIISEVVTLLRNGPEVGPDHSVEFEAAERPFICLGDRDQLVQVFWNLARNGLEAMPEGGALEVRLSSTSEEIALSIRDQGRGMTREERRHIFEPFHSRTPAGSGLGLAIVYRIVREHNGDIAVESTPLQGTEVTVRLPVLRPLSSAAAQLA